MTLPGPDDPHDARTHPPAPASRADFAYRPALDGIRALAVLAVLLFHGGLALLPGGFLGVDAFFVLSGFLITSLLLSERAGTGGIRLTAFWIRRARRLLPALLLVLLAVVGLYREQLAGNELALLRGDALAALGYVANWRMIYRGDDYFARSSTPSPLQHTWSLGIEEQFYLLWPLILVVILWLARGRSRTVLLAVCLAGVAGSALAGAALYRPLDVNRAYFGTDARAQALLIGCALAVVLFHGSASHDTLSKSALSQGTLSQGTQPRWLTPLAGALGGAGLLAVGWLWTHTHGDDRWLYLGGFTAGGLAVAAVIGHTMLSPRAPVARALAVAPLVWIGRISYGVYLWHWPLYGLLNAERTGLAGAALLLVRLAVTLAVAALSYVLVEQPIRTGRWPQLPGLPASGAARLRTSPAADSDAPDPEAADSHAGTRHPARRILAGTGAVVAVVATGAIIVSSTAPTPGRVPGQLAIPVPSTAPAKRTVPIHRDGRRPGALPRVTFFGDSVSWSLGTYLPPEPKLAVTVRSVQGCGIARLPDVIQLGEGHTNYPACPTWDVRWRGGVEADDPDLAVILLDRWELMDRKLDGVYRHVGQPEYDAYLMSELDLALSIVAAHGAQAVLLTAPYTHRAERPDGGLYDEDQPERVDAWNRLLRSRAQREPTRITVLDLNKWVCPDGKFTWDVNQLRVRSDGLHFTPEGVQQWIAPWLLPQLFAIATGPTTPAPSATTHPAARPTE